MHIKCSLLLACANLCFNSLILISEHRNISAPPHSQTQGLSFPFAKSEFKETFHFTFGQRDLFPSIITSETHHSLMLAFIEPPHMCQSFCLRTQVSWRHTVPGYDGEAPDQKTLGTWHALDV